ncbi:putative hydro-lyase [Corticicoccus populi]|uniref:Putative hydro-lyase ACFSX4_13445 n=1 Tax=Corticicoccus populi TaxID=1812821 RepID=A0ABW5WZS2_9STAP
MEAKEIRERIRMKVHTGPTSGISGDKVQANLVVLPKKYAFDFLLFAVRNKKPVPVIEVIESGEYVSTLAEGSDIRTDIPKYHVYKNGEFSEETDDVSEIWQEDFVTFLIGCSFTFEQAVLDAGIPIKHIDQGRNVAMYKTNIETVPAGIFNGSTVVSMRPFPKDKVEQVIRITEEFPDMHGGPVHAGAPSEIGIDDISKPDYGEFTEYNEDEVPVFWACGVTPQNVILNAKPEIVITHAPGYMFITDLNNEAFQNKQ